MTRLSIIIVSYNVKYYLEQCLWSVLRAANKLSAEIWVVDNASTDGTLEYLQPRFPEVRFIANHDNKGFSAANNQAIRLSDAEYVLLLNPDTIVGEDVLQGCISFLDEHPNAGATGVRMLNVDGSFAPESRRGVPTPFTSFCKMSGLCRLFPRSRVFGRYYLRYLDVDEANQIDIISGAFIMLRRTALDAIGLLDERFFMYGEDVDLSFRLLQGGWQNWYLPLNILHYKGESTVKSSFKYVHIFYNAMLIFFNKHYGHRYRLLGILIRMAVYARALVDALLRIWQRVLSLLHCSSAPAPFVYLTFDLDAQPVSRMLDQLRRQSAPRRVLRTQSRRTGMVICHNEVYPLEQESNKVTN
ncbi:MAG: glycosyltransferase family 2 protein [Bacteroidaceae bacterium]